MSLNWSITSQGFGWAIAKALAEAGAEISIGVWVSVRTMPARAGCMCGAAAAELGWGQLLKQGDAASSHLKFGSPHMRAQVPALNIFETSFRRGKFDESRKLSNGSLMDFKHIYPMDAVFDTKDDVPEDVSGIPR
jgi:enoyl-[acyl-carrier protein] reductase I